MRFKTFRNLVIAGGATVATAAVAGIVALVALAARSEPSAPAPAMPAPRPVASAPASPGTPPSRTPADSSLRPVDVAILTFIKNAATSDKVKDAFPRQPYKVNLYKDGSGMVWTRLKIDLDRDELDDEKWDLVNGAPSKRHVSTKDDGTYDLEYRWDGSKWVQKTP